jgi:hypothetical protein
MFILNLFTLLNISINNKTKDLFFLYYTNVLDK